MPREDDNLNAQLSIGDGVVVLRFGHRSRASVVNVLGMDLDAHGAPQRLYLDRLVHRPRHRRLNAEWAVSGAVSSILTRDPIRR